MPLLISRLSERHLNFIKNSPHAWNFPSQNGKFEMTLPCSHWQICTGHVRRLRAFTLTMCVDRGCLYSATCLILLGIIYAYSDDEVICASFLKFLLERPVQVQISDLFRSWMRSDLVNTWVFETGRMERDDVGQRTQTNKEIICKHVFLQKSVNTGADLSTILFVKSWTDTYFSVVGSSAETKVSIVEYGIGSSNDQIRDVSL